jgi:hypothetical protein
LRSVGSWLGILSASNAGHQSRQRQRHERENANLPKDAH